MEVVLPGPGTHFILKFLSDGAGGEVLCLFIAEENLWRAAPSPCTACSIVWLWYGSALFFHILGGEK